MGQYYRIIFLNNTGKGKDKIIFYFSYPFSKLTEQAFFGNELIEIVEYLICNSCFNKVVWAGDYADPEPETVLNDTNGINYSGDNLFFLCDHFNDKDLYKQFDPIFLNNIKYRYLINHTKKLYVDKTLENKTYDDGIDNVELFYHPLPILLAEGNGKGGGDYYGNNIKLAGTWARDDISTSNSIPDGYNLLECKFNIYPDGYFK